jgi:hypothetical protein
MLIVSKEFMISSIALLNGDGVFPSPGEVSSGVLGRSYVF